MSFPAQRLRRLRRTPELRGLVRETRLSLDQLVMPVFVCEGDDQRQPITSMPGVERLGVERLVEEAARLHGLGLRSLLLFGVPGHKDPTGAGALVHDALVPRALRALRAALPDLVLWADVCLCDYTDHGHCGVLHDHGHGAAVDNDATVAQLAKLAVLYATDGADIVAPSDMMDGRVGAIRTALEAAGHHDTIVCSYAAKYASALYGPFREAANCAPREGNRRSYQMDPANTDEALREVALDNEEGADLVMVKPAMTYGDVVRRVKERFGLPVAAYHVSGEYAMIHAAAERGWIDLEAAAWETTLGIRRAGADIVITYFAPLLARLLAEGRRE